MFDVGRERRRCDRRKDSGRCNPGKWGENQGMQRVVSHTAGWRNGNALVAWGQPPGSTRAQLELVTAPVMPVEVLQQSVVCLLRQQRTWL